MTWSYLCFYFCFCTDWAGHLREIAVPLKKCSHSALFIGLRRQQGEIIQEGRQFDIRGTVDEFRFLLFMYVLWRPGMDIYISHVCKKHIPLYVFADGHKRTRLPKVINQHPFEKGFSDISGSKCEIEKDMEDVVKKLKGMHLEASTSTKEM